MRTGPQDRGRAGAARPVVGALCCNRMLDGRRVQAIASRFVEPLAAFGGVSVLLVPALPDAAEATTLAGRLDGLLLTGACSNVAPSRYGGPADDARGAANRDRGRDETALRLGDAMIAAGRPVFGICRGLQELNVLFGGSLADLDGHYARDDEHDLDALFGHAHALEVTPGGLVERLFDSGGNGGGGDGGARVNSIHRQGIDRLGGGLTVEARAPDAVVEAVSARPCGAPVLGVQWHPEWDVAADRSGRGFFDLLGRAARGEA